MVTNNNFRGEWFSHLVELRRRLIICLLAISLIFATLVYFANALYKILEWPLLKSLPAGYQLIAISIASPLLSPLKLAFVVAVFVAIPILLYHLWAFAAPGLYGHERRWLWPLLFISIALFYLGVAFAYVVVFPLLFKFFAQVAPANVRVMPDINHYLDFTLQMFFAFGMVFEVPIGVIVLMMSGVVNRQQLTAARPYVILSAFVIGMLIGPPDVLSQTTLAIPICLLFELGIVLGAWFLRLKSKGE